MKRRKALIEHELFYPSETGFYCNDCPFKESYKEWQNKVGEEAVKVA